MDVRPGEAYVMEFVVRNEARFASPMQALSLRRPCYRSSWCKSERNKLSGKPVLARADLSNRLLLNRLLVEPPVCFRRAGPLLTGRQHPEWNDLP